MLLRTASTSASPTSGSTNTTTLAKSDTGRSWRASTIAGLPRQSAAHRAGEGLERVLSSMIVHTARAADGEAKAVNNEPYESTSNPALSRANSNDRRKMLAGATTKIKFDVVNSRCSQLRAAVLTTKPTLDVRQSNAPVSCLEPDQMRRQVVRSEMVWIEKEQGSRHQLLDASTVSAMRTSSGRLRACIFAITLAR